MKNLVDVCTETEIKTIFSNVTNLQQFNIKLQVNIYQYS